MGNSFNTAQTPIWNGGAFLALASLENDTQYCTHPPNSIQEIIGYDAACASPIQQAHFYSKLPLIHLKNHHQPRVASFVIPRSFFDVLHKISLVGPYDLIEKIEVCTIDTNTSYSYADIEKYGWKKIQDEEEKVTWIQPPTNIILDVIETVHTHQLDFFKQTQLVEGGAIPIFINRAKAVINVASYSTFVVRLYLSEKARVDQFSLAGHGSILCNIARKITTQIGFNQTIEQFTLLTKQSLASTRETCKISLNALQQYNNVSSLLISVYNKTKQTYETDVVDNCTLHFHTHVYCSYDQTDILHNQLQLGVYRGRGRHIIIPFASSIFGGKLEASINFSKVENVSLTLQLKPSYNQDEYECAVSASHFTTLRFSGGSVTIKK